MKYLVVILATFVALTTAQEDSVHQMTTRIAHGFAISQLDAEKCVHKMALTPDDLRTLRDTSFDNIDSDNETMKKVICTLTCCAQAQGSMIGSKLHLPTIHRLIQESWTPPRVQLTFHKFVDECAEVVEDLTDECEVGLAFVRCISRKPWNDVDWKSVN